MSLRISNFVLVAACLCIAASAAYCAPTIGSQREALSPGPSTLDSSGKFVNIPAASLGSENGRLGELGSQLLNPPASTTDMADFAGSPVKSLPPVPAAVFMVLSGFVCVSLVRDRRFWLAALAAVFWVGQTGIENIPRLAQRLTGSTKELSAKELEYISLPDDYSRARSDLEGTEYIGLLHHLGGIPQNRNLSLNQLFCPLTFDSLRQRLSGQGGVAVQKHTPSTLLSASLEQEQRLNSVLRCLDSFFRQHISFSPAFIFASLPRGPPQFTSKSFHTVGV